jgi:hypothetical protein
MMDYRDIPLYPFDRDPLGIVRNPLRAAAPEPPPDAAPHREESCPADGGADPPSALPLRPVSAEAGGEGDLAQGGGRGSASDAKPVDPPRDGDDLDDEIEPAEETEPAEEAEAAEQPESAQSERIRLMRAWLNKHFDTVEAMARAGEAPVRPAPADPEPGAPPEPDEPAEPPPPVHVRKGDRWNKPKMAEFLRQLAATHSVTAAARSVGLSRESAHRLRNRLKGQPFDVAWEAAFRQGYDNLPHSALELALEGEEVPHYYHGKLLGTHRKRNPQLIIGLLKLRNRAGAPMLGRYGAAAEYWSENWDRLLHRVETGSVTWDDERQELGPDELARLDLPDEEKKIDQIIVRNLPDDPPQRRRP